MAVEAPRPRIFGAGPRLDPASGALAAQALRHIDMRRDILDRHPEVRGLIGPDWRTAFASPLILAMHWTLAWAVSRTNLLVVFLAAFFVGQIVIHAAGALVHETRTGSCSATGS